MSVKWEPMPLRFAGVVYGYRPGRGDDGAADMTFAECEIACRALNARPEAGFCDWPDEPEDSETDET